MTAEEFKAQLEAKRKAEVSRMTRAASEYARADRTDPFAVARAMAHIKSGVAAVRRGASNADYDLEAMQESFYDAKPRRVEEDVLHNGVVIGSKTVVRYYSVVRP